MVFKDLPEKPTDVRPVEPSAKTNPPASLLLTPALMGSRPGTYTPTLPHAETCPLTRWQRSPFHEGIPGYHMQIGHCAGTGGIPSFRKVRPAIRCYTEAGPLSNCASKEMGLLL